MTQRSEKSISDLNLSTAGQSRLQNVLVSATSQVQQALLAQLDEIDLPLIQSLWQSSQTVTSDDSQASATVTPLGEHEVVRQPQTEQQTAEWAKAGQAGKAALRAGRVGCVVVAGGQGTRLGFDHPKGMFPVGPVSQASLFQFFFERLIALQNKYDCTIPYFIMTSHATHQPTLDYLKQQNYFGLPESQVHLFQQGTMPAVDAKSGELLLASDDQLALSPDGHGGMLQALAKAGLLKLMKQQGIDLLYYHQVDNPGARLADAELIGWHLQEQAELTTKVACKRDAYEKMGIVANSDGKHSIVEYSDLPAEMAEATDDNGSLQYWAGNMGIHVFQREFLERLTTAGNELPFHLASKKVPHLNEQGKLIQPETPNAIKFERFIFDALPAAKKSVVVEALRKEEFNPVKNAEGSDSPATTREALQTMWRSWLAEAGYDVDLHKPIEISPLRATCSDDLIGTVKAEELVAESILLQ